MMAAAIATAMEVSVSKMNRLTARGFSIIYFILTFDNSTRHAIGYG
jgi:hypothetical protein